MGELVKWPGMTGSEAETRAGLASRLQQRWLRVLNSPDGVPDVIFSANVYTPDLRTGRGYVQGTAFHGPVLATIYTTGDERWGPMCRRIILGIDGKFMEVSTSVHDQYQRSWWNWVTVDELTEEPKLARLVLEGFDSLLATMSATEAAEDAQPSRIIAFPSLPGTGSPNGGYSA